MPNAISRFAAVAVDLDEVLSNPDDVPGVVLTQLENCVARAMEAGAHAPLTFIGAGMTALVFCDVRKHAFKVYRYPTAVHYHSNEAEAEWLLAASEDNLVKEHVARFIAWYPSLQVLERDCIAGRPGGWGTRGIRDAYEKIVRRMEKRGWRGPEYKEDSFIQHETRGLVLVDAGFVLRTGENLLNYVRETLAGTRKDPEPLTDLAFALRIDDTVDRVEAVRLHDEIEKRVGHKLGL